jgi:hypothetical protein
MKHGWLSLIGLALCLPVLLGAAQGSYELETAAFRLSGGLVVLLVVDRLVLPGAGVLLALMRPEEPTDER